MTNPLSFDGEVVIVTGAGGGLGRAYAMDLARRGARVVVNDLGGSPAGEGEDARAANRVVEEITALGGEAVANFNSVATQDGGAAIVQTALDTWGRLDGLISNAGILRDRSFAKLDYADAHAVVDVHLWGGFHVSQPAFLAMKDSGYGGRILLTTSASGLLGNFGQTAYGAAKMGLVGLMRSLRIEGERAGVKVNALAPIAGTRLTNNVSDDPNAPKAPNKVVPIATLLVHRDCPANGEIFMAGAGWFSKCLIGLTRGWADTDSATAESLLENWDKVTDEAGFAQPESVAEVSAILNRLLKQDKWEEAN